MAKAMKCDRCHQYYDRYDIDEKTGARKNEVLSTITVHNAYVANSAFSRTIDLCPRCMNTFLRGFMPPGRVDIESSEFEEFLDRFKEDK